MKYKFGQWITVSQYIRKIGGGQTRWVKTKFVNNHKWPSEVFDEMRVMIIGKRTVQEGKMHYDTSGDYDHYFNPDKYIPTLLVAWDMNRNPVYVLEEDIIKIDM